MKTLLTLLCLSLTLICNAQRKYVTPNGAGNMDGSSWANAWNDKIFADTLITMPSGTEIWLAKGYYAPTKDTSGVVLTTVNNLYEDTRTFRIPSGVKVIGGFAGNEASITDRDIKKIRTVNETTFYGYNSNNVPELYWLTYVENLVTFINCDETTGLDGVNCNGVVNYCIVMSSYGNYHCSPQLSNIYVNTYGPMPNGLFYSNNYGDIISSPKLTNCVFSSGALNNDYLDLGMVSFLGNCSPEIIDCIFYAQHWPNYEVSNVSNTITLSNTKGASINNCIFYFNTINHSGILPSKTINTYQITDSVYINNCIFQDDFVPNTNTIGHLYASPGNNLYSLRNCFLQPQTAPGFVMPAYQLNTSTSNPQLKNGADPDGPDNKWGTADDGLQLNPASPAIDFGMNELVPANLNKDITGNARVSGCKVDAGPYEYQNAPVVIAIPNPASESCTQYPVGDSATTYIDPAYCQVTATVTPSGANAVNGIIKVCVVQDAAVQFVNGIPYVQRRYNIEPLQNASTATAKITVYYTQAEFDDYNAVAGSLPKLPANATDVAGIANVKIEQDHGISLTGMPGTYNGSTVYIDPDDTDIIWDAPNSIWKVSFDVAGFSGFFVTTGAQLLPVSLISFTGTKENATAILNWKIADEINLSHYEIFKSTDGVIFTKTGLQNATGSAVYYFNDNSPAKGINYYKLSMVDKDGATKYSNIIAVSFKEDGKGDIKISPNPVTNKFKICAPINGNISITLKDINGNLIKNLFSGQNNAVLFTKEFVIGNLPKGVYIVEIKTDDTIFYNKILVL